MYVPTPFVRFNRWNLFCKSLILWFMFDFFFQPTTNFERRKIAKLIERGRIYVKMHCHQNIYLNFLWQKDLFILKLFSFQNHKFMWNYTIIIAKYCVVYVFKIMRFTNYYHKVQKIKSYILLPSEAEPLISKKI